MHIDRTGRAVTTGAARRKRTGPSFTPPEEPSAPASMPDPPAAACGPVPMALLGDQAAAPSAPLPDAACAARGAAVLDALAGLQKAALGGGGGPARQALADLAQSLPQAAEPGLEAVLQAIAQRAAIELARAG